MSEEYKKKQELVDELVSDYIENHSEVTETIAILAIREFEEWKRVNHLVY